MSRSGLAPGRWVGVRRLFQRVTSSGRYIPELDGLRFVAVTAVFLYHLRSVLAVKSSTRWASPVGDDWLGRLTHEGNAGVPFFFMISGFIVSLPFAAHRLKGARAVDLGAYFGRRLTRLTPPYLLSLTLFLVLLRVVKGEPWGRLWAGYLSSAFYLHNLLGDPGVAVNAVAWSLEVEVQFYALAPLLVLVFSVRHTLARRTLLVGLAAAAAALQRRYIGDGGGVAYDSLANYLQYFFAGFLLADVYLVEFGGRIGHNPGPFRGVLWDLAGLASVVLLGGYVLGRPAVAGFLSPVLFLAVASSAFQGRFIRWLMTRPALTAVGGMSYSIYLIHYPLISLFGRFTIDLPLSYHFGTNLLAQTALIGPPCLAACAGFYLLVEQPSMRLTWPRRPALETPGKADGARLDGPAGRFPTSWELVTRSRGMRRR